MAIYPQILKPLATCTRKKFQGFIAVVLLLFAALQTAAGEPERFAADRPGFAFGTHTVQPGTLYFESGYQYSFNTGRVFFNYSNFPVLTLRTGLTNRSELFISWDGWTLHHKSHLSNSTGNEIELPLLGAKYSLVQADDYTLTLLAIAEPEESDNTLRINPAMGLLWDYEITENLELFGMGKIRLDNAEKNTATQLIFALGASTPVAQSIDIFLEYYTIADTDSGKWTHGNEAGVIFFMGNDMQIDLFGGIGHRNHLDHYIGLGFAKRI